MSSNSNSTFDRIQKEIKESIQREKELKNGYAKINNNNCVETNHHINISCESNEVNLNNGDPVNPSVNQDVTQKINGYRKFTPNTTNANTRGVMQKFLKYKGRLSLSAIKVNDNTWMTDAAFKPAKITVEKGKPLRKGYVPAEEKMKKELQEFQVREAELRSERRKSQPDLMAALQLEEDEDFEQMREENRILKPAKSMANLCSTDEDDYSSNHSSAPGSLKPARSLAELCDLCDEEIEMPGTYSLIMQFENLKNQDSS